MYGFTNLACDCYEQFNIFITIIGILTTSKIKASNNYKCRYCQLIEKFKDDLINLVLYIMNQYKF